MNEAFVGDAGAPPGSSPGILPGGVVPEGVERQLLEDLEDMRESAPRVDGSADLAAPDQMALGSPALADPATDDLSVPDRLRVGGSLPVRHP